MSEGDFHDPKGLVREAYMIEGITLPECRSILLDWALSLPLGADPRPLAAALLARHGGSSGPSTGSGPGSTSDPGCSDGCVVSPRARR